MHQYPHVVVIAMCGYTLDLGEGEAICVLIG